MVSAEAKAGVRGCVMAVFILFQLSSFSALASESRLEERFQAGFRGGFSADTCMRQAELVAEYTLPWAFPRGRPWVIGAGLEGAIGWMGDDQHHGAVGSLGPKLRLTPGVFPVSLVAGFAPTVLTRRSFREENYGSAMQFTSSAGLEWNVTGRYELGYRFQHMSNGSLGSPNPGLNLHMFGIFRRF
jgi:hypothetical protein